MLKYRPPLNTMPILQQPVKSRQVTEGMEVFYKSWSPTLTYVAVRRGKSDQCATCFYFPTQLASCWEVTPAMLAGQSVTPSTFSGSVCEFDNMVTELQSAQSSRHRVEKNCELMGEKFQRKQSQHFPLTRLSNAKQRPTL